jgi:Co/Zn/Cd efflux system component
MQQGAAKPPFTWEHNMDKRFAVVLAAIALLGAWTIRPQTVEQAREQAMNSFDMDKCRREMSMGLDGITGRDAIKACESVRKLTVMMEGR